VKNSVRTEFMAIPIVLVILGFLFLVMFAAVEGVRAWVLLGLGALALLTAVVVALGKRHRHPSALDAPATQPSRAAIEQDPAFALRIMVDIAAMALSPAVNAPTTAVQVLDHLEDFMRWIGARELPALAEHRDQEGRPRLLVPSQDWDELLALAVTEIRLYGGSAIQVVRRLRAMLEGLREAVRPEYRPAVEAELMRLEATVAGRFAESPDLDRARRADRQGIGGPGAVPRNT
jgi:hypothetical protein